jgi:DNA-directed RNA polymerase subunit RPC12/RpoP
MPAASPSNCCLLGVVYDGGTGGADPWQLSIPYREAAAAVPSLLLTYQYEEHNHSFVTSQCSSGFRDVKIWYRCSRCRFGLFFKEKVDSLLSE